MIATALRFLHKPLLLVPDDCDRMNVELLLALQGRSAELPDEARAGPFDVQRSEQARRPYDVIDRVAVIPVCGILVHGPAYSWCGETSYDAISASFALALADPEVAAIVLYVNSPGGEVAGAFDCADAIFAARGTKPIVAILDEGAYSAGYMIGCAADRMTVPRTGGVGSIGAVTMHLDITEALAKFGFKITTVQFGDRKTDYYPTTPLSKTAKEGLQTEIDRVGEMFVDLVARNRGLSAKTVRDTQARLLPGPLGVEQDFADAVMAPGVAFSALVEEIA